MAIALLIKDPLVAKGAAEPPISDTSGLQCLTSRSLPSNQATWSCSLASKGLMSWGLGYAKAGQEL